MKPLIYLIGCSIHKGGNSDTALEYAGEEAKKHGVRIRKFYLRDYEGRFNVLIKKIKKKATGIIFATPVYFGDCSSYLFEFLRECREENNLFLDKVVGFISVGAKRNGGQETTIVHSAWEVMEMGAMVVNDGAPVSQFGGTCVAGKHGPLEDFGKYGIEQAKGVGRRVAETAKIIEQGKYLIDKTPINVLWLVMEPKEYKNVKIPLLADYGDDFKVIKTYQYSFSRCQACVECPRPNCQEDYKCRNKSDSMYVLHPFIVNSNVLVPLGFDMRFLERMRYLRRDNYRLTYHIVRLSHIRQVHIFIKQNSILCRRYAIRYGKIIKAGKQKVKLTSQIYEPIGH